MNTLLLRSLSGIVYVLLFLGALFASSKEVFFMWCAFLGVGAALEIRGMFRLNRQIVFVGSSALLLAFYSLNLSNILWIAGVLSSLAMTIILLKAYKNQRILRYWSPFYAVIGILNLYLIYRLDPYLSLSVLILVWTNDSLAYAVGSLIGKTKVSSISPKKSLEGYTGGLIGTLLVSYGLNKLGWLTHEWWIGLAFTTSVLANLGDLIASKMKRLSAVKDSGRLIPGHGGILDRIDSLIFLAPILYLLFKSV